MSGTKEKKAGFPMQPLIWLVLYLANLAVVLLFQCTFIHTHSAPLTADSLTNLPYFDGCQILDIFGTQVSEDALRGKADPNWILFQDPDGKILSVRVEWNLYVPRFRIEEDTAVGIPADVEQYSFVERDFFGQNEIVVDGQNTFSAIKQSGLYRQQSTIQSFHVLAAILLLLLESFVCYGVKRIIRQNPIKKQNQ